MSYNEIQKKWKTKIKMKYDPDKQVKILRVIAVQLFKEKMQN